MFSQVAAAWLASLDDLALSTIQGYRKIISTHFTEALGRRDIRKIRHSELRDLIAGKDWKTPKTRNNVLSVLKRIFAYALQDGIIERDPTAGIKFRRRQAAEPDPLTLAEIEAVLGAVDPAWRNYFEFAFFSGLRVSELVGLVWDDVDLRGQYARVRQAKVRGERKGTKTYTARDVQLNSRSLAALKRQRAATYLAGGPVFVHPATGAEINDDKPPRLAWDAALKAAGVRRRPAKNTRHTYATLLLMSGEPLAWSAKQMGHSVQMMLTVYARWVDQEGIETGARLGHFLGQQPGLQRIIE